MPKDIKYDRNGNSIEEIEYGFFALKGKEQILIYSGVYKLGIYLYMYRDNKIYNQVSKDTVPSAQGLLNKLKKTLTNDSYEIIPIPGTYTVKRTKEGYFLKPFRYDNPRFLKPNKK